MFFMDDFKPAEQGLGGSPPVVVVGLETEVISVLVLEGRPSKDLAGISRKDRFGRLGRRPEELSSAFST